VAANAADKANRNLDRLDREVAEILRQADETDQREDREHGSARGEELPAELANPTGRLVRLREAKARLEAEAAERQRRYQTRVAQLAAAARARGQQPRARIKPRRQDEAPMLRPPPAWPTPTALPAHQKGQRAGLQRPSHGRRAADCGGGRAHQDANDLQQLQPMLQAVDQTLVAAEIPDRLGTLPADSGYWSIANLTSIPDAPELLVWPSKTRPHRQAAQGRQAVGVQEPRAARGDVRQARRGSAADLPRTPRVRARSPAPGTARSPRSLRSGRTRRYAGPTATASSSSSSGGARAPSVPSRYPPATPGRASTGSPSLRNRSMSLRMVRVVTASRVWPAGTGPVAPSLQQGQQAQPRGGFQHSSILAAIEEPHLPKLSLVFSA
jgi:hypothetical protein